MESNGETTRPSGSSTTESNAQPDRSSPGPSTRSFRLQGKRFFFTWPRCTTSSEDALSKLLGWRPLDRCMVARELHADGTPHLHALLWLKRRMDIRSCTTLDAILGQHGNYQGMRDPVASVKYLLKEDTSPAVFGFDPNEYVAASANKRVARTGGTWDSVVQHLREGRTLADFENQAFIARNLRHLLRYDDWRRSCVPTNRVGDWRIKCMVIWGPTGMYKSTWGRGIARGPSNGHGIAGDTFPLPYQRSGGTWWDGYRGQRTLLLDDFDPSKMPLLQLLRVLDSFTFVGEVKGSVVTADWTEVIITNNIHPDRWYPTEGPERMAALLRRLKVVYVAPDDSDWCKSTFDEIWSDAQKADRPANSSNLVE